MNKDYLTSSFNDENFKRNFGSMRKAVEQMPIIKINAYHSNSIQFITKNIESITKTIDYTKLTANSRIYKDIPNIGKYYQENPAVNQTFKNLEQVFQNVNFSTNSTNLSSLLRDVPLVTSNTLFNHPPLSAWEESEDDSVSESPSNMEEKTSDEIDSDEVSEVSNNLLEQATDYGKKFSHGFFAPIKDPEELGKLVFEIMFSSLCSVFFSLAITYGVPTAQNVVASLYLEIQRRISQSK